MAPEVALDGKRGSEDWTQSAPNKREPRPPSSSPLYYPAKGNCSENDFG